MPQGLIVQFNACFWSIYRILSCHSACSWLLLLQIDWFKSSCIYLGRSNIDHWQHASGYQHWKQPASRTNPGLICLPPFHLVHLITIGYPSCSLLLQPMMLALLALSSFIWHLHLSLSLFCFKCGRVTEAWFSEQCLPFRKYFLIQHVLVISFLLQWQHAATQLAFYRSSFELMLETQPLTHCSNILLYKNFYLIL